MQSAPKRTFTAWSSFALVAIILFTVATASHAQGAYPVDSIRLIVPANPGGGTDTAARLVADALQEELGVNITVVNQAGGGGAIAEQTVLQGSPDGSKLLFYHAMMHAAHILGQSPYSYRDFTPLATVSMSNDVYAVRGDAPWSTLGELLTFARENPGEVVVGSQLGGTTQVKGQALEARGEADFRVVDVGTESDRVASLLGGHVDVVPMSVGNAQQYVESGDIKVLAVLNEERDPFAPDWPTATEQGVDIHFPLVFTLYGPEGLDEATVELLSEAMGDVAQNPEFQESMARVRQHIDYRTAEETAEYVANEYRFVQTTIESVEE